MSQNSSQSSRRPHYTEQELEELQDRVVDQIDGEYEEIEQLEQTLSDNIEERQQIRREIRYINRLSASQRLDQLVYLDGLHQELQNINVQIRINSTQLRDLRAHLSYQSRPPSPQTSGSVSSGTSFSRSSQGSVGGRSRSSSPESNSNSNCSQGCGGDAGEADIGADQHGNLWRNGQIIRKFKFGKVIKRKMNNLRGRRNQPPLTITVPQPPQQQVHTKTPKAVQLSPKSPPRSKFGKQLILRRVTSDLLKLKKI